MQKFCTNCGAQLDEDVFICPNCGALPDSMSNSEQMPHTQQPEVAVAPPVPAKKTGKFKLWMVAVPALLIIAVVLAFTWQSLLMMIAPRAALSLAAGSTSHSLEERYDGSPVALLNKVDFAEQSRLAFGADINYAGEAVKAKIQLDYLKAQRQCAISASLRNSQKEYAANMYLDPEFAAASLNFFDAGTYYGLTFDSFKEDIKKSFLGQMLEDEQIDMIDTALQSMLDMYTMDTDEEALLEPYRQVIEDFVTELEAQKGTAEAQLDGNTYQCNTVSFVLTEEAVVDLMKELIKTLKEDPQMKVLMTSDLSDVLDEEDLEESWDEVIKSLEDSVEEFAETADFDTELISYVRNGRLVQLRLDVTLKVDGEEIDVRMDMVFGLKPESDLIFELSAKQDGEKAVIKAVSSITNEDSVFHEKLKIAVNIPDADKAEMELTTKWNKETGRLTISAEMEADGEHMDEMTFTCKLKELENGFEITIDQEDLKQLLDLADVSIPDELSFSINIACTAEVQITKPDYVNLDKWNEDMFARLQEAISNEYMIEPVPAA